MPEVSLLMPFYMAEDFIAEALASLQQQSLEDWELIAVDDHSNDQSRKVIEAFAEKDPRIKLFLNPGQGILPALQLASKKARGTFVGRFDADDILPSDRLELMAKVLRGSQAKSIVTGLVQYFSDRPISKGYSRYQNWLNETNLNGESWEEIYRECVIASPNWLMRRSEFLAIGGFEGLQYPEDYDWCFRCYQQGFEVQCLTTTTLMWREHPHRTSRNSEHYQQKAFFRLKLQRFIEWEAFEELILWGSGRKARLTAALLRDMGIRFRWMDLEPDKYPDGIHGHPIEDYRKIESHQGLKLLIGVYPNPAERKDLEDFLISRNLQKGTDYWYL